MSKILDLQSRIIATLKRYTQLSDLVRSNPTLPLQVVEQHLKELESAVIDEFRSPTQGSELPRFPFDMPVTIDHDGFRGTIIGHYITREGKAGVVLQHVGSKIVHVYGEKWIVSKNEPDADRT